ncbi:MAG: DUF3828 domain-containing protein [Patescibacteria group bacterium]|nr:DUF3828 domain-containing protein [Patescibacteria group bacterium]
MRNLLIAFLLILLIVGGAVLFLRRANQPIQSSESVSTSNTDNQFTSTLPVNTGSTTSTSSANAILNTEQDPAKFVLNFYTWYIRYISKDPSVTLSSQFSERIAEWLTQDFAANWQTIAQNNDMDPFLLSQTENESWLNGMQAKTINASSSASSVKVNFGDYASTSSYSLLVQLNYSNHLWKISSISHAGQ